MCVHTGTHIDAPDHFLAGGKSTEDIPLENLVGECLVVELPGRSRISKTGLEALMIPAGTRKLVFKTDNSRLWNNLSHKFYEDYCALTADAAEWIRDSGIHLVGIDYLSVSLYRDPPENVHRILLEADVVLVEGLNLTGVSPGPYRITCLPLRILNVDGAPARVILEG